MNSFLDVAVVIPVYNPEPMLAGLCEELLNLTPHVVVVDDGSVQNCERFAALPSAVNIIRHECNRGKGCAIKTGMDWVNRHLPAVRVVTFVDGDGQHRPADVERVALRARVTDRITLGVRDFTGADIPFRSRFGNSLTSFLVRCIYRFPIGDTQTGLRAVPRRLFAEMIALHGERYEYEMRLFAFLKSSGEQMEQVPIRTVYIESNRASHFHPVLDSIRVYRGLFGDSFVKFCASSLLGFVSDNLIFAILLAALQSTGLARRHEILIALLCSRFCSSTINYACNRWCVFGTRAGLMRSYCRYWLLVCLIASLSYLFTASVAAMADINGMAITLIKIFVELFLFALSYLLQRKWVFRTKE